MILWVPGLIVPYCATVYSDAGLAGSSVQAVLHRVLTGRTLILDSIGLSLRRPHRHSIGVGQKDGFPRDLVDVVDVFAKQRSGTHRLERNHIDVFE